MHVVPVQPEQPAALAVAPDGGLYVVDGTRVLERLPSGRRAGPQGVVGIGRPARQASIDGADGLAYDAAGNLFLSGSNTKTPNGIAVASDGTIYADTELGNGWANASAIVELKNGKLQVLWKG